ncbi:hypothetical protein ADIARSV_0638 [Arcticibacter svalbardensis MN12-7]|uniref:Uncharacterized protein n=1 Tax=Arcticibacter svalbardensis MN12-7 TaxID=1150600 RepID=R9GXA6_9SPHI|nr:hypothetical protein ADIARSV_0638 [Arcticibacter svalbardensis MN12-7]
MKFEISFLFLSLTMITRTTFWLKIPLVRKVTVYKIKGQG